MPSVMERKAQPSGWLGPIEIKAANGIRTRDLNLGKVALYQLSYSHMQSATRGLTAFELEARAGVEPTYTDLQSGA